jgi:hypothetical protein
MKEVVIWLDESNGNLLDLNGLYIANSQGGNFKLGTMEEKENLDVAKLISLGLSADDLIKLKANKVI